MSAAYREWGDDFGDDDEPTLVIQRKAIKNNPLGRPRRRVIKKRVPTAKLSPRPIDERSEESRSRSPKAIVGKQEGTLPSMGISIVRPPTSPMMHSAPPPFVPTVPFTPFVPFRRLMQIQTTPPSPPQPKKLLSEERLYVAAILLTVLATLCHPAVRPYVRSVVIAVHR